MSRTNNTICLALATVAVLSAGSGCALPVIEGVFDNRDFALFDSTPEARADVDDEVLLVFLDLDEPAEQMRTVSVDLVAVSTLPVGEEIAVGDDESGLPFIDVVEGTLVREKIEGKGELLTVGDDAKRAISTGGTVILDESGETLRGSFHVDLDDGGYLEGSFTSSN